MGQPSKQKSPIQRPAPAKAEPTAKAVKAASGKGQLQSGSTKVKLAAAPAKAKRGSKRTGAVRRTRSGLVILTTIDGVNILQPRGKPKSFTIPQLRRAIAVVLGPGKS